MTTIYLIRHGEAEGNLYRRMQGHYNSDLTALGRRQVEALGRRFSNLPIDAVYSSDLYRAMETAASICSPKRLVLHTDPRLQEVNVGPWEDETFGTVWATDPVQMRAFVTLSPAWQLPGADTVESLCNRGMAALRDILARHPDQTVAVCAHGMMIRTLLCHLMGTLDHPERVPHGFNTAVSKLTVSGDKVAVEYINQADHLPPALMNPPNHRADMDIRPMAEDAAEEYIRYRKDAWQVVYGDLRGFDGPGFWLDAQRSMGKDPKGMVVGYLEGKPAGMIQLNPGRDANKGVGYIPFLYLREPYRHQGLGIQLIGHAVSYYRRLGRTKLQLSVYPGNQNALGFYHKYGFTQVKKQRGRFGHLLLMEKDISLPADPKGIEILRA